MASYNYKVRRGEIDTMPTLQEVLATEEGWVKSHQPVDKATRLNQYMFKSSNGDPVNWFIPFAQVLQANPDNLPVVAQSTAVQPLSLTSYALDQLLIRMDVQKKLFYRLPAPIRNMVINWCIQNDGKVDRSVLFRLVDNASIRALMSEQYEPFDNLELLQAVSTVCPDGTKLTTAYNNEQVMHLSLIFPNTITEIKAGDLVESGIHISNSEVGMRSVTIASYHYRLLCSNGAIGGGDGGGYTRFRHIGNPDRIRDAVRASIESTTLEATKVIEQMRQAVNIAIDKPIEAMEKLCKENEMTADDYKAMMDNFFKEPDPTAYGVFNAITATARDRDGEDSYQMARLATKVLSQGVATGTK